MQSMAGYNIFKGKALKPFTSTFFRDEKWTWHMGLTLMSMTKILSAFTDIPMQIRTLLLSQFEVDTSQWKRKEQGSITGWWGNPKALLWVKIRNGKFQMYLVTHSL